MNTLEADENKLMRIFYHVILFTVSDPTKWSLSTRQTKRATTPCWCRVPHQPESLDDYRPVATAYRLGSVANWKQLERTQPHSSSITFWLESILLQYVIIKSDSWSG